jgi:hypothetical protein
MTYIRIGDREWFSVFSFRFSENETLGAEFRKLATLKTENRKP